MFPRRNKHQSIECFHSFRAATKPFKSALKSSKTSNDEPSPSPPPIPAKTQLQARTSTSQQQQPTSSLARTNSMSKSMVVPNSDSPQIINSDSTHELIQGKPSMSTSSYGSLITSNKDEQKETQNSSENLSSPAPPVSARTGKVALGTRVLPAIDPNGEVPQVKLRPLLSEKKGRDSRRLLFMIFHCSSSTTSAG